MKKNLPNYFFNVYFHLLLTQEKALSVTILARGLYGSWEKKEILPTLRDLTRIYTEQRLPLKYPKDLGI